MTRHLRAVGALMAWLAFLLAMVITLQSVGGRLAAPPLSGLDSGRAWLEQRQPVDVVFAALRLVVLALGWYLLVVTVMSLVARLLRLAAVVRLVDVVTVPGVRRLVNTAAGFSMLAGYPGLAAAAETPSEPPVVEVMRRLPDDAAGTTVDGVPPEPAKAPTITMHRLPDEPSAPRSAQPTPRQEPTPVVAPAPTAAPAPTRTAPAPTAAGAQAPTTPAPARTAAPALIAAPPGRGPASWPVRPGDHFWAVAERVLAEAWGRTPTDAEVSPYWRTLVETNRPGLPDPANPDLLFAGQTLTVPAPPARPS